MSVRTAGIAVALSLALAGRAAAQTPAEKADELNEQGKDLYRKGDLPGAADRFRQAIVLSPEGRFYYNLCAMLDEMGRLGEALTACEAVASNGASDALKDKTNQRIAGIKQRMAARGAEEDGNPGDGGSATPDGDGHTATPDGDGHAATPDGTGGNPAGGPNPGPTYPPPGPGTGVASQADPHAYKWSLGGDIGILSNLSIGQQGDFADSGPQLKLHVDFLLSESARLGVQGYVHFGALAPGNGDLSPGERLSIFDAGAAVFQHRRLTTNTYYTPLAGAQVSALAPGDVGDSLVTFGFRGEVALNWLLSANSVITFAPTLAVYLPASAGSSTIVPSDYGLDKAGATLAFTVGYTRRFTQPFGSNPFIVLE